MQPGLPKVWHRTSRTLAGLPFREIGAVFQLRWCGQGWAGDVVGVIGAELFLGSWAGVGVAIGIRRIGRIFGAGGGEGQPEGPQAEYGAETPAPALMLRLSSLSPERVSAKRL